MRSGGGINARDPQLSEFSFAGAPMGIGVIPTLFNRLDGRSPQIVTSAAIPLRKLHDSFAAFSTDTSGFDSWHSQLLNNGKI
jgi:hypothetical protein